MAKLPDHMRGINALPSVQAYNAAVAAARPAATMDEARAASKQLESLRLQAMRDKNKLTGKDILGSMDLSKQIKQESRKHTPGTKATSLDQIKKAAKAGKTIWADQNSDCFESLSWSQGVAHAVFNKRDPGDGYDYDMPLEDFLDWVSDGSLGEFFNAEIR
jgi:hypothetical protein